jgi:hypothetical protein
MVLSWFIITMSRFNVIFFWSFFYQMYHIFGTQNWILLEWIGWSKWWWEHTTRMGKMVNWWNRKAGSEADGRRHRGSDAVPPIQNTMHDANLSCNGDLWPPRNTNRRATHLSLSPIHLPSIVISTLACILPLILLGCRHIQNVRYMGRFIELTA